MTILVTGSSGHLGEALVRTLQAQRRETVGIDVLAGAFTDQVGSIADRAFVRRCMKGVTTVLHTAALHKPHVATHSRQDFVDVNISGTLNLLEEAAAAGVTAFVYTSTTSVFGDALVPPRGEPAAWITEDVTAVPKNIYGVTKAAAENLCQLFARNHSLGAIVLRTSRFFPEEDDNRAVRDAYTDANIKTNEFLYRRVDIEDVVSAHPRRGVGDRQPRRHPRRPDLHHRQLLPRRRGEEVLRGKGEEPAAALARDEHYPHGVLAPDFRGHSPLDESGVFRQLHIQDRDYRALIARLQAADDIRSPLAREVGSKGYHDRIFREGPYPVE